MRCGIEDKAAPKTGGVTNQCPQSRRITFRASYFEFRACFGFRDSDFEFPPIHRGVLCETNPIPVRARHAVPQKHETNPISAYTAFAAPYFCETNPIYTPANSQSPKANSCFLRNEPNPRTAGILPAKPPPIMQNEPNFQSP